MIPGGGQLELVVRSAGHAASALAMLPGTSLSQSRCTLLLTIPPGSPERPTETARPQPRSAASVAAWGSSQARRWKIPSRGVSAK